MKDTIVVDAVHDLLLEGYSSEVTWLPLQKGDKYRHDGNLYTVISREYDTEQDRLTIYVKE